MKKKIFYWSPCLDRVGTVISTINSAISLSRYDKNNDVRIINVCGEWDQYREKLNDNSVNLIDLNFKYFKICCAKTRSGSDSRRGRSIHPIGKYGTHGAQAVLMLP